MVAAGLGGEERDVFLGGKRKESILLDSFDSAFDYSLTDIFLGRRSQSGDQPRGAIVGSTGDERVLLVRKAH